MRFRWQKNLAEEAGLCYGAVSHARRGERLRFIAFLECATEDLDEMISTWNKRIREGRQVKTLLPPYTMADAPKGVRSFTVFETEDEDEIMKYVTEYGVISKVKIYPIWESSRGAEMYKKMKR